MECWRESGRCDDKDRFGRFDIIDQSEVVAPLRRAGRL
jgi:hypothetical protein